MAATAQVSHLRATVVNVIAGAPTELKFSIRFPAGPAQGFPHGTVVFKVRNAGKLGHTFKVCSRPRASASANSCAGTGTPNIAPGKTATLTITFKTKGNYEYLCTIPGHAAGGM
jgi:uncharacterized cupredoxin-like copper-binding protein